MIDIYICEFTWSLSLFAIYFFSMKTRLMHPYFTEFILFMIIISILAIMIFLENNFYVSLRILLNEKYYISASILKTFSIP